MSQFNINQRFEFLSDLTSMVVLGATPSLLVMGEGGLGKTHTVNQTIKSLEIPDTNWIVFK
jgi:Cdc6-like AAA superfamily ATPase